MATTTVLKSQILSGEYDAAFAKLYGEDTQETQPAEVAEDTAEAQDASDDTSYDATAEDGSYTEEYAE